MTAGPYSIGSDKWPGVSKVIEECGELQQVLGKLMANNGESNHWDGSDLRRRLHEEIADLDAAIDFLLIVNDLDRDWIAIRSGVKFEQFLTWHQAPLLSQCCNQPLRTESGDEGTGFYVCTGCNKPSDPKESK